MRLVRYAFLLALMLVCMSFVTHNNGDVVLNIGFTNYKYQIPIFIVVWMCFAMGFTLGLCIVVVQGMRWKVQLMVLDTKYKAMEIELITVRDNYLKKQSEQDKKTP